jgi:glycosyltransferase involved in cell wall biosynthesis
LFSSQFFNVVNYLLVFSKLDHEFTWIPLVPIRKKDVFERRMTSISELGKNIEVRPIFLQTPSSSFKNLLNPRMLVSDFAEIFRTVRQQRPDAVIVFYVLNAFPIAMFKSLLGCKLFTVATGGDINLHRTRLHRIFRRMIYRNSDMVFAVSKDLGRKILLESGCKAVILSTGVDSSFFRPLESRAALRTNWGFSSNEILALTVSNLEKHKGVDIAIKTIGILRSHGLSNIKLMIVGEGSEKDSLRSLIAKDNLETAVLLLGEKNRRELLELYNIADFFLLTSHTEGLPFALLEAMACKKLCISSAVGDIPEVIKTGYNGFIADSIVPSDFALKVERALAGDKTNLAAMANNARQTVRESFDLNVTARHLMNLISNRLSSKN